ncbi:MAG: phosphatase PAP2 family protein [Bacteroidota bacterium]
MKAFPNYKFNTVHIGNLYEFEKHIFGIRSGEALLTPNEFFSIHSNKFLDLLSGFFYLCWIPVPLLFAAYLFLKKKEQFFRFSLTFLLANFIGFIGYYLYPAAPPWYIHKFGTHFYPLTPGNAAGLERFDSITGLHIFKGLYAKSSNVFAAVPSLHSAYPVLVLYYGLTNRLGWINIIFTIIMVGIWFSAVYNNHHYIVDVLLGIGCAIAAIISFNWFVKNTTWADYQLKKLVKAVE